VWFGTIRPRTSCAHAELASYIYIYRERRERQIDNTYIHTYEYRYTKSIDG